ncbi:MAG: hypothetical protein F4Z18_12910 [Caldilineaceae bacterium SB0666_bin_21]|nr:hypothetical protein [Caldilineaceae bacterium SB0666_bin_21]
MRKVLTYVFPALFVLVLTWTLSPSMVSWAEDSIEAKIAALHARVQTLEDRIALTILPPYTFSANAGNFVRQGEGNWSGIINISEPGTRIFIVELVEHDCASTVKLYHQGGTVETRIAYICVRDEEIRVPVTGAVLDFDDFEEEFSSSRNNFPLGNYSIQVESDVAWKITVLTND